MEEEDVSRAHTGHDPHQPAHVCRPGAELPQVQPGGVRGSDKEINHHPITHVEALLYNLQVALLPAYSVEHGGHDEQARQSGAVQPCCDAFPFVIRQEVQQRTAHDTGNNPKSMCSTVRCMFILGRLISFAGWDSTVHE